MKVLTYIIIIAIGVIFGYIIGKIVSDQKGITKNIIPLIDELKIQLKAITEKLKTDVSNEEREQLEQKKQNILNLLSKFYGFTVEEINKMI